MAFNQDGPLRAYPTNGDQSANQYRAMALGAAGLAVVAAIGARIAGVLTDDPEAGRAGTIQVRDVAKVRLGAAVARGDLLMTDATGALIPHAAGAAGSGTRHIVGEAVAAGAANSVGSVELRYLGSTTV